jgi:hypothetical protein
VSCSGCKAAYLAGYEEPDCFDGECKVGLDRLPPLARRILEVRGVMMALRTLRLNDYICREFDLDQEELKLLAHVEKLLKPKEKEKELAPSP